MLEIDYVDFELKQPNHLSNLPSEVLLYIFNFLSAQELTECRRVCSRWKRIIDGLTRSVSLWRGHCKKDFTAIYKSVRMKTNGSLSWYQIYRSLSLWSQLSSATVFKDEFAPASRDQNEILNFSILGNGLVGVHKRGSIAYYDLQTLEPARRNTITGTYVSYQENNHLVCILDRSHQLIVISKSIKRFNKNAYFNNINMFLLNNREVYYVNGNGELYLCQFDDVDYIETRIQTESVPLGVMCLGYSNDRLNVLTVQRNVYTVINKTLVPVYELPPFTNIMHSLNKYKFLESLDWGVYINWSYLLNLNIPWDSLQNILKVYTYGDIVFVGTKSGVLKIYYAPYIRGELNLFDTEPVKEFSFVDRHDCPVLYNCPIRQVDVYEVEDGHVVLVAMPKKIAVLKFMHNFKRTASVAMLPYEDIQQVKKIILSK